MEQKKEKHLKERKTSFLSLVLLIICTGLMIFSGIKIIKWAKENKHNKAILNKIADKVIIKDNEIMVDFEKLKEENDQIIGWLKVEGTDINYPVVKTNNNDFYLYHSFDKEYNTAGWIFADYDNKCDGLDQNLVIYGHNRKDGSMFGTLKNILDTAWCENEGNRIITLVTEKENIKYKVFSVYRIENEDYYIKTRFNSNEEFGEFVKTLSKRSIYNFEQEIDSSSKILTLSTCADNNNYRVVLHAVKID